jgi:hypothetical protein
MLLSAASMTPLSFRGGAGAGVGVLMQASVSVRSMSIVKNCDPLHPGTGNSAHVVEPQVPGNMPMANVMQPQASAIYSSNRSVQCCTCMV